MNVQIIMPVYNGANTLEASLRCLLEQDCAEILILDNASTDRTPEIVRDLTLGDPRVSFIRRETNIGGAANFADGLKRSTREMVAFRAHDDVSSPDYFSRLAKALRDNPNAVLAVGSVVRRFPEGRESTISIGRHADIGQRLIGSASSWYYGLWRRGYFSHRFEAVAKRYPHLWAHDHATMFEALATDRVAFDPEAIFVQLVPAQAHYQGPDGMPLGLLKKTRDDFIRVCRNDMAMMSEAARKSVAGVLAKYVDRKVWPRRRIWKRQIREIFAG